MFIEENRNQEDGWHREERRASLFPMAPSGRGKIALSINIASLTGLSQDTLAAIQE
jgi:hypothetical protein